MTCPSCGGELVPGADRCPVCDASVAPRVEGALAADPRLLTPPARGKVRTEPSAAASEPIREIPGLRRRDARERAERGDRSWRDEVQERIRSRRQKRTEAGLPLFEQEAVRPRETERVEPASAAAAPAMPEPTRAQRVTPAGVIPTHDGDLTDQTLFPPALTEAELADLPLRAAAPAERVVEGPAVPVSPRRPVRPSLDDEVLVEESDLEPGIEIEPPAAEPSPLERPARALERAQAAAFDLALFAVIAAVVVYFAGRAARVDLPTLATSWRWFLAFVGLLAGFYASYFTGTTGQTPGKLLTGLRVVDAGGRPPGYPRALGRALVGLLGVTLAGAGLAPIAFDPAGRALHDRLFRTRVVRR